VRRMIPSSNPSCAGVVIIQVSSCVDRRYGYFGRSIQQVGETAEIPMPSSAHDGMCPSVVHKYQPRLTGEPQFRGST